MNENIAQEILHELFSSLEALETQSAAIVQFLIEKGLASEEELAPHFEQAGNASNVRWRAARVRIDRMVSNAMKTVEQDVAKESAKSAEKEPSDTVSKKSQEEEETSSNKPVAQEGAAISGKSGVDDSSTKTEKKQNDPADKSENAA